MSSFASLMAQGDTWVGTRVKYAHRWGNTAFDGSEILGGYRSDAVTGVAVDAGGNVYVAGRTYSKAFPSSTIEPPTIPAPHARGFVGKLKPDGSDFAWLANWDQCGVNAMTVDASGNLIVAGATHVTHGDAFLAKYDASGSLLFTRTLSGIPTAIALDTSGNIFVAGTTYSSEYPTTPGALQQTRKNASTALGTGFVTKFDPTANTLLYSTYLGGSQLTEIHAMTVDAAGFAYLAGTTTSADFPTTDGALQPLISGTAGSENSDGFVAKLDLTGGRLVFSTLLGGSAPDSVNAIAVDSSGASYVAGSTKSADFPVTSGAFVTTRPGASSAFVSKLSPSGAALSYSTYYGDSASVASIAVARNGWAFVTGETSGELPVWVAIQPSYYGGSCYYYTPSGSNPYGEYTCPEAFLAAFNENGSGLAVSTYLSGTGKKSGLALAVDAQSNIYVGGRGALVPPTTSFSSTDGHAFLLKLGPGSRPPMFTRQSITNAANFSTGLPLPGGAASAFVGDLARTDNVSVKVDGVSAPLYVVTSGQINFQVPFDIAPPLSSVEVAQGDAVASVRGLKSLLTAPAIFTYDGAHGAIQHGLDYRLVTASAPAERGEVITIYLTGLGTTTPPVKSGEVVPLTPLSWTTLAPTVWIGGQTAEVLFSGLTPGTFGLYQINARVPESVAAGDVQVQVGLPTIEDETLFLRPPVSRISRPVLIPVR
ncbi:MAG: SBBP repeat-containing protein [Acidobacteriales bacterium]|nr:SBBP repeat-containing protein [Terriglobales bacterium]